jgi:hypothetical protein
VATVTARMPGLPSADDKDGFAKENFMWSS